MRPSGCRRAFRSGSRRPARRTREWTMRRGWTAASLAGLCAMAACSSPPTAAHPASLSSRAGTPVTAPARTAPARPGASQPAEAVPAAPAPPRVTVARMRTADGSVLTVATFAGPVTYVLHDGSEDPGAAAGRVQASPVIDRSGQARIGVWGDGVPAPGEAVYSVRQDLTPLVLNGRPTAAAADWGLWGATLGGGEYVARSALGQDASGDLIYAASMSTTPADLAFVLAYAGARIAMELDINPEWVQLDVARHPGGALRASVPGQYRPADQYLAGWARDFIAVLGPPPAPPPVLPGMRLRP